MTPIGDVLVCPYVHIKIGNIYEGTFNMPDSTIICNKPDCVCAADVQISKALPEHVNKLRVGKNGTS